MIQEKSGFWDSIDATPSSEGDERTYPASDVTIPFEYLVSDGVQTGGTKLQVSPGSYDYSTQIAPGMGWIKGKWYLLYDDGTGGTVVRVLLHDVPIQYSRIDRVVLRYDANYTLEGRHIYAALVKGAEAETPAAPALTRTAEIYELSLAQVLIKPGQPAVLEADITDERFDGDFCGIAGFAPQPDLQPIIDAFTAQLQAYFADIQVDVDELIAEMQAGGLPANMLSTTPPSGQSEWVNGQAYLDGLKVLVDTKADATDVNALEAKDALVTTAGTAPNFTITPSPAISAYADGQIWTVRFHADAENPALAVSGLASGGLYTSDGKAAKVKSGQIARVMRYGTGFFTLSGGGGVSLPQTIEAGETIIYATFDTAYRIINTYTDVGSGYIVTINKAGAYRIRYYLGVTYASLKYGYARLTKNGTVVTNSELTVAANNGFGMKYIDIACNAGDVIRLQAYTNYSGTGYIPVYFGVSILANDVQSELDALIAVS